MSVWNRIGDIATTVGKTAASPVVNLAKWGGEVAESVGSTARVAWDFGTAPWNDADEYNGFIQSFKTAAEPESKDIIKPLASAGGAIMKVPGVQPALERINNINQEYIRQPAATFSLAIGEIQRRSVTGEGPLIAELGYFDPNLWRDAYKGAQEISFGQATVGNLRSVYDPKFNIYDPAQRDAAFKKSGWGKAASGGTDLALNFFGDVLVVGGKVAKIAKASKIGVGKLTNANTVAKAAEDITKAQYGVKNRFTKVLDDFAKNDSTYAISHPMVKSSSNPALLAHLLGDSVDVDETAMILRSALGDTAAMDELRLQRAYITDALEAARGDLDTVTEFKLFAAPDESGMLPFLNENPAVIKAAQDNYTSLIASDKYFAKFMQLGEGGGVLTRTTGKALQGAEDFVAKARAIKFYDQAVGASKVDVYQPTPFHRLYQRVSWLGGERPAGLVDFNDADSYREIVATLQRVGPSDAIVGTPAKVKRLGLLTQEQSNSLLNDYIAAATPEARFIATQNLEETVLRSLAVKHGIDEEAISTFYNQYKGARTSAQKAIQDRGFMVDTDGSIITVQQLESQSANFLPLMDFDLADRILKRNAGTLNAFLGRKKDGIFNAADIVQDMFKAGALLRLGYTQRNAIDSQLRIAASVGAMASLRHLGPGVKNIVNNTVNRNISRLVDEYSPLGKKLNLAEIQVASNNLIRELEELKSKIGAAETKLSLDPDDVDLMGEVNTLKLLQEEKLAVYDNYAQSLSQSKKALPKDRIGTGSFKVTTSDGQEYILDDGFGGPLSDMFRRIASSGNSFERMVDSNTDMYVTKLASKGIQAIRPTDPGYFDQWAQTLRQQFGNSAVVRKLARGETIDDVASWLKSSPEGRDLRSRLTIPSSDSVEYVTRISNFFDTYLPVSSNLRNKLSDITAGDLRTTFKDPTDLPIIHGHLLEETFFNKTGNIGTRFVNAAFKLLATLPEDALARNPMYVYLYRQEARRRIDIVAGLKGDRISLEDQQKILSMSHKIALREMKSVLFNIERKTNFATLMKYINPFFSAQENAYKTWMKLAVANPAVINRGYQIWQSPNRMGLVTDQDGNQVPVGQTSGSDIMWLSLPEGLTQALPGLSSLTEFGIPKASLDIIFQGGMDALYNQGNPNMFSDIFPTGPYVAVPVAEITKNRPDIRETLKFLFPYGYPKSVAGGFLPTWTKRLSTLIAGQDDPQFARSYSLIYNTEQQKAKSQGLPPVKPEKILKMTKDYWNLRTAATLIMPFSPRFETPYKFYLDKSREYDRVYGVNSAAKFLEDYPEYFAFSASLSKNPTGVQSSIAATKNIKKYSELIGEVVKIDPKLVGLVVNDPSGYEFSQSAYDYLYKKRVSADAPDRFLSSQSPAESQRKTDAEKGWIQYNKFMDILDTELAARGLTSIQQTGAQDLAIIKDAFINKLAVQTDAEGKPVFDKKTGEYARTAWYDDYLDDDGSKTNRVIAGLGKILSNPEFVENNKNSTTWKSVTRYLEFRKSIAQELLSREAKSLNAKSNADLRIVFDAIINKLKQDDKLGFTYIYDRFLSQDLTVDKQLTPKAVK
jgi:hypothetical protein